ncbi:hypothetical protein VTN77DRAFT_1410 [Rasamsonia byssochlamydoides]|uniref:uncharacterized protein n=1 Tax=Rasamsonia byssochlamydoides TaxID=89139 RepID=UPI0037426F84
MSSNQDSGALLQKEKRKREETFIGENAPKTAHSEDTPKRQKLTAPASLPVDTCTEDHEGGSCTPQDDSNSSSDDEIGPRLPPRDNPRAAGVVDDHIHSVQSTNRQNSPEDKLPSSDVRQRDEWMLLPPDKRSWMSKIDPTALRNRKFNTAKSAQSSARGESGPSTAWTENPAQKKIRLENEVMGIQDGSRIDQQEHASGPSKVDDATAERIKLFNEKKRKTSLYENHKRRSQESNDDPSSRPFDREKDIAGPAGITSASRREMLKRAADYTSRFSGGKFL